MRRNPIKNQRDGGFIIAIYRRNHTRLQGKSNSDHTRLQEKIEVAVIEEVIRRISIFYGADHTRLQGDHTRLQDLEIMY